MTESYKEIAKRWLEGIYTGKVDLVADLATEDVAISYPIFQTIFEKPAIRGRDSVKDFVGHFARKWSEGQLTIHDTIEQDSKVALLWSYTARNIGPSQDKPPTNKLHSWGGISLIRFDEDGKVVEEIGEESAPGPYARMIG